MACAHCHAVKRHPFTLNGFNKFHKGSRSHDGHGFTLVAAKIHAPQAAPQGLLGQNIAFGSVGAQAHNGRDIANVPAFFEHHDRHNGFVRRLPGVNFIGLFAKFLQFILAFARRALGNVAIGFGVNDQHGSLQFRACFFKIAAHLIAISGVIDHHKQHGFFAQSVMLGSAFAPFLYAQLQIVGVFFGDEGAGALDQFVAAGGIGQNGVFDDVLGNGLDQGVIADGLHKYGR